MARIPDDTENKPVVTGPLFRRLYLQTGLWRWDAKFARLLSEADVRWEVRWHRVSITEPEPNEPSKWSLRRLSGSNQFLTAVPNQSGRGSEWCLLGVGKVCMYV